MTTSTMMPVQEFAALVKTSDPDGVVRRKPCTVLGVAIADGETQWVVYIGKDGKIWPELVSHVEPNADDYWEIDPPDVVTPTGNVRKRTDQYNLGGY